jgi:phosphatidylserine/phosphatidylglycerophosphate/cardiolipin synthase-like enzyme
VDPDRVRVFYRCGPGQVIGDPSQRHGDYHTYVHAKLTIIDDEFAVVGTVNYNRRSWYWDTEISLGIYDPSSDIVLTNRFAHWLRMRLWAEHLFGVRAPPSAPGAGVQPWDQYYAELFDPVASGERWVELIKLQQLWEAQNPGTDPATYNQGDYDTLAEVRPYDVHFNDYPQEVFPGPGIPVFTLPLAELMNAVAWDSLLDPGWP